MSGSFKLSLIANPTSKFPQQVPEENFEGVLLYLADVHNNFLKILIGFYKSDTNLYHPKLRCPHLEEVVMTHLWWESVEVLSCLLLPIQPESVLN